MPRISEGKRALLRTLKELQQELESPGLSTARRRAILRQHGQAALSLSKLEQLEMRAKLEAVKVSATKPQHEPTPKPTESPTPNLLGTPVNSKIRETPGEAHARRLHERMTATAQELSAPLSDDNPPSKEQEDATTATPALAVPAADGTETEESNSEPEAEPVRKMESPSIQMDTSFELMSALERQLWDGDSRKSQLLRYTIAMPGELPPQAPQSPPPRVSWWAGGPGYSEPPQPKVVDNSDWEGNRLQDAQHPLRPEPELAHMDSPRRDLRQFLSDVAEGKDNGE